MSARGVRGAASRPPQADAARPEPRRQRGKRRWAAALAAVGLGGLLVAAPAAPAPAATDPPGALAPAATAAATDEAPHGVLASSLDPLQVVVDQLAPVVPADGDTLTLVGRVVNTTDAPVAGVGVRLRVSPTPLANRSEVAAVADGTTDREGNRVQGTRQEVTDSLAPGAEASWRIAVPFADLGLQGSGVFLVAVEAVGTADGATDRLGLARTTVPWFPAPVQVRPSRLVWLWPLVGWPARGADGVLVGDRTGRELSVAGRLRTLLDLARASPAPSVAVDADLLQTAADMGNGYRVLAQGLVRPGERARAALAWTQDLRAYAATSDVTVLPFADPDAVALRRAGLDRDVTRAVTLAPVLGGQLLGGSAAGSAFWAPGGDVDQPTLDALAAAGVRTVVLDGDALPTAETLPFTPTGSATLATASGTVRAVLADPALTQAVSVAPGSRADAVAARQRFLAETAMVTMERPGDPRTVVVAPGVRWNPDPQLLRDLLDALRTAPWVQPATLGQLLAEEPSTVGRSRPGYSGAREAAELPGGYLAGVRAEQDRLAAFAEVVDDTSGLTDGYALALLRAGSAAWRAEPRTGDVLVRLVRTGLDSLVGQVRASGGSVTIPGESGVVPVTVANDLDRPVTVGLRLTGDPEVRLEAPDVTAFTVAPGRRITKEVEVRVRGPGAVAVRVALLTPTGTVLSQNTTVEVRSAAYVQAAAWAVGMAFGVLVLLVAVRVVRRVGAARGAGAAAARTGEEDAVHDGGAHVPSSAAPAGRPGPGAGPGAGGDRG